MTDLHTLTNINGVHLPQKTDGEAVTRCFLVGSFNLLMTLLVKEPPLISIVATAICPVVMGRLTLEEIVKVSSQGVKEVICNSSSTVGTLCICIPQLVSLDAQQAELVTAGQCGTEAKILKADGAYVLLCVHG